MAVIFDGTNLTAVEAVIFGLVQVVFFYCPFLDCLYHVVTTLTVGVTSFTNHSVYRIYLPGHVTWRSHLTVPSGPLPLTMSLSSEHKKPGLRKEQKTKQ